MTQQKILVIDDSRVIRARVRDMLPQGDYQILEAKDGIEGLNLMVQEQPTLVVLDFILPKMNGWEVYQEIQKQPRLQIIPLIIMSGRKQEVTEKLPEPFEHFEFIEKPFEQNALIRAMGAAFRKAKEKEADLQRRGISLQPLDGQTIECGTDKSMEAYVAEVQLLNQKVVRLQEEVNTLKRQMSQVIAFLRKPNP